MSQGAELKRQWFAVALAIAIAIGVSGCTGQTAGGGSPTDPATVAPSTTSSISGTTTSTSPPASTSHSATALATPASAVTYVNNFWRAVNTAWTTPMGGLISSMCLSSSKSCASLELEAQQLVSKQQRYDTSPVVVKSADVLGTFDPNKVSVISSVVQQRANIIDSNAKIVETDQQKLLTRVFTLRWTDDRWVVVEIEKTA